MTIADDQGGPCIELERSLPSEVAAISPFVDKLMLLIKKCGCVLAGESDVEIALREVLANAIIPGNHENPENTPRFVAASKPHEVSIVIKDEGRGFDIRYDGVSYSPRKHRFRSWPVASTWCKR